MKIDQQNGTLNVSEVTELAAANAPSFRATVGAALAKGARELRIDLSQTRFLDCNGLGALVALRNRGQARQEQVAVKLLNPTQAVRQIMKLTRMDNVFCISTS